MPICVALGADSNTLKWESNKKKKANGLAITSGICPSYIWQSSKPTLFLSEQVAERL